MKFIQVFNRYLDPGGEESSADRIAHHLQADGHIVIQFWKSSHEWTGGDSPSIVQQALLIGYNKEILEELRELHAQEEADAWILHNVIPVVSLGVYKLAGELNIPIVNWLHNYRPLSISGKFPWRSSWGYLVECLKGDWRGSRLQSLVLGLHLLNARWRGYFNSVSVWIAVSQSLKLRFVDAGWHPNSVEVLHHSWEIEPTMKGVRQQEYYLYLGRLEEIKGIKFLVELFSHPSMRHLSLYICGSGGIEDDLKQVSTDNVHWCGYVKGEQKRGLIRGSRAVLFPSLWDEPLSTIAYEAFQQERCLIASAAGGTPEIIVNRENGVLLPPGNQDSWRSFLLSVEKHELERWGKRGRVWLKDIVSPEVWNRNFRKILSRHL